MQNFFLHWDKISVNSKILFKGDSGQLSTWGWRAEATVGTLVRCLAGMFLSVHSDVPRKM